MSHKSKVFLVDIDGVACAHAKSICLAVNVDYGLFSTEDDVVTYDHNFGPITFKEAVEKYYPDEKFVMGMSVSEGFSCLLEGLKDRMTIKFATARRYSHDATRLWIKQNFGDSFEVLFTRKKVNVEFDYLIDDYPPEVEAVAENGKIGFLLSRPWNNNIIVRSKFKCMPNAFFVENWAVVIAHFRRE